MIKHANKLKQKEIERLLAIPSDTTRQIALDNILIWWWNRTVGQTKTAYAEVELSHLSGLP